MAKVYIVRPRAEGKARLVKALRESLVRDHILKDFDVAIASTEEAVDLGRDGVTIEDLTQTMQ